MAEHGQNAADSSPQLPSREAAALAAEVAELAKAGLPLPPGLRAMAAELPGRRLPAALREIADHLEAGAPLEAAIETAGPRLPGHFRGLLLAGVRSGRPAEVMEELVELAHRQVELRRRVWLGLAYPIVLLSLLSVLFVLLQGVIVPQFVAIFKDFAVDLPQMTRLFLWTMGPGAWLLALTTVALPVAAFVLPLLSGQKWASRILYLVPLLGPLWRWSRLAEFSRLMAILLEQKVALPEALRLASAGVADGYLAGGCREVATEVEQGRLLCASLASKRQFPPSLIPLVEWGQQTPAVPEAFRAAAEMFEGRTESQGVFLETIALPVTFLVIVIFTGFAITAMFLPLISLIQKLSG